MRNSPKALLPIEGTTFIEKIIYCLIRTDCAELIVVLGAYYEKIMERVDLRGVKVAVNEEWEEGQLSSLRLGIRNLSPQSEALLFTLVDHPLVKESTYSLLIDEWKKNRTKIIVPTFHGQKGHPALFPGTLYSKVLNDELPDGARGLLRTQKDSVLFVAVEDSGILYDIDTPQDYERRVNGS